jgi:flagellar hook-associated protein 2
MATSASLSTTSLTGLGLTGLSSGLDTSGIITKLMAIESQPQTQLKTQLTDLQTHTSSLQSLNTAIAAVATTAKAALGSGALNAFTATSTSTDVTATAGASSVAGTLSFTVDRLASAQTSVSGTMATWPDTSSATPSITIQVGTGTTATTKTFTAGSANLDDVVTAINKSGTGVQATKIAAGTDSSGTALYRLQLSGASGAANAFSVFPGSSASGTALPTTQVSAAQDAALTLYSGTSVQQQVTSKSNTFNDLLTGVDVTVAATSSASVTLTVAADPSAATASAAALTAGLISTFAGIASSTAISTSSSTSGGTSTSATTGGVFTGDSLVRTVNDALLTAATAPVNGKSPSSIGINLTKDGTITFDQSTFEAAMKSDPAGTTAIYQAIAQRVSDASAAASDSSTGSITQAVTSEQGRQSDITAKVSDWDTRLATIQAQYETQFNAMEVALNSLSSQSSYLTSQIAGLTTNYQSTS